MHTSNGSIEYSEKILLMLTWFEDLEQERIIAENRRQDYNHNHPHSSLNGLSPITHYMKAVKQGIIKPRKFDIKNKKLNL